MKFVWRFGQTGKFGAEIFLTPPYIFETSVCPWVMVPLFRQTRGGPSSTKTRSLERTPRIENFICTSVLGGSVSFGMRQIAARIYSIKWFKVSTLRTPPEQQCFIPKPICSIINRFTFVGKQFCLKCLLLNYCIFITLIHLFRYRIIDACTLIHGDFNSDKCSSIFLEEPQPWLLEDGMCVQDTKVGEPVNYSSN